MIRKYFVTFLTVLAVLFVACSQPVFAGSYDDAESVYSDPSGFDGGSGSTLNEPGPSYSSDVPDVGDAGPIGYQDEGGDYHSYDD
ncbi:MAG: hypothetical protein HQ594_01615 [Candidatus Omnitrophica bacterium]|nr:hypothetical protein [Candidatus Omnitrophota bacterium]